MRPQFLVHSFQFQGLLDSMESYSFKQMKYICIVYERFSQYYVYYAVCFVTSYAGLLSVRK